MMTRARAEPARGVGPVATVVVAAVVVMSIALALDGATAAAWFQVVAWACVGAYTVGVRHQHVRTTPWWLIGAGVACVAIGEIAGPVVHVAAYPLLVAGLASLVGRDGSRAGTSALIDAGILVIPVAITAWVTVIGPVAADATLSIAERITAVGYPIGDLLCLCVVARLVAGLDRDARVESHPALALLVVATAALLLSDLVTVRDIVRDTTSPGGWSDALALGGFVALAVLAWTVSMRSVAHPRGLRQVSLSRGRLVLLAAAALVTPGILWVQWLRGDELAVPLVLAGTAASFLLVIARMNQLMHEIERARRRLHFDATHDALTGLPNRQLFDMHLDRSLRSGRAGGVMFVDLDHFKDVNDTFGHQVGDEVLQQVADTLRAVIREDDLVARLSGDEFVVLVETADDTELFAIARRIVERLRITRMTAVGQVTVTASVGLARWDTDTGVHDAQQLVRTADDAMYRAKQAAGDQLVVAVG